QHGEEHLLGRDEARRHRREQPVLDLARPPELGDERERERLHTRDHRGQRQEAREEQVRVAVLRVAEAAEHLPEHEEQEERLQDHLREEGGQLAPGDVEVALEYRQERTAAAPGCGDGRAQRNDRPVRWMNTSSSVGVPSRTSPTATPREASTAAAGATTGAAAPLR